MLELPPSELRNERPVTSTFINVNQERDMKLSLLVPFVALVAFSGGHGNLSAQQQSEFNILSGCRPDERFAQLSPHAEQVAEILGIKPLVEQALAMRASRPAGAAMTLEELSLRQELTEATVAASFDVDGVLAEIEQEQAHIAEVSAFLQARRDRGVNLASLANVITGSGVGIAVNALQFSSSTADVGNGIGVGSGVASTALSLVGIRLQRGPKRQMGSGAEHAGSASGPPTCALQQLSPRCAHLPQQPSTPRSGGARHKAAAIATRVARPGTARSIGHAQGSKRGRSADLESQSQTKAPH